MYKVKDIEFKKVCLKNIVKLRILINYIEEKKKIIIPLATANNLVESYKNVIYLLEKLIKYMFIYSIIEIYIIAYKLFKKEYTRACKLNY